MDSSEVKPGMKGYGLTVFRGWDAERFDVEIIDVMKNDLAPKEDMILARVSGNILEKSKVIAGMSGSPVYINGRLIGAVAYSWSFSVEAVCGITPIYNMIKQKGNADPDFFDDNSLIKHIGTPLMISGFSGKSRDALEDFFKKRGFEIAASGGNGRKATDAQKLKAGDAVALNLVDGDFNIAAIGTVTYVSNKDVYIFGHPMGLSGNISLPISKAYIYTVISSQNFSFKLGVPSQPIGATVYDGNTAVYCKLGKKAGMIPVKASIKSWNNAADFNFRVAAHKEYMTMAISSAIYSSIQTVSGMMDDKTMLMKFLVELDYKGLSYRITNTFQYISDPSYYEIVGLYMDVNTMFSFLMNSGFGEVLIKNIQIDITVKKGIDCFLLQDAVCDKSGYYAGETVKLKAMMRKYRGNYTTRDIQVKIPQNIKPGTYKVFLGNASEVSYQIAKQYPGAGGWNNFEDVLNIFTQYNDAKNLRAAFVSTEDGVVINNYQLADFPVNYISILNIKSASGKNYAFAEIAKNEIKMEYPLFGGAFVQFEVLAKDPAKIE